MNLYSNKSKIKLVLLLMAIFIGLLSLYYTDKLVKSLAEREQKLIDLYAKGLQFAISPDNSGNLTFLFQEIIEANSSIPVILTDAKGEPISFKNLPIDETAPKEQQQKLLQYHLKIMKSQYNPIVVEYPGLNFKNYIYYENSSLLTQLKYYPYFQLSAITVFILIAYFAFSYSRKTEQNKVWVGLAKETAHQLGTPLSGLMAWIELLRADERFNQDGLVDEMNKDIQRLAMITERFSKIGSLPSLKTENILESINYTLDYLKKRTSDKIVFSSISMAGEQVMAKINRPLFEWVIENVCKNSIDAMGGKGTLTVTIIKEKDKIYIDMADTGKGIPKSQFNKVFQPGFTTKQRGWGLGLTLVKRIIEEYHQGKIFVKHSELGKGTVFRVVVKCV